jgi:hypothetical protein
MAKKQKTAKRTAKKLSYRAAMSVATNVDKTAKQRVAAIASAPLAVIESDKDLEAMLTVLRNTGEPIAVRLAAFQALQAAAFSVLAFASNRGDYIATLRKVATDPDPELRQRVLGALMRDQDGFAQKKLLDGLKDPGKALVPPEKALQLLSYDIHADAYKIAREIVKKPPNDDAKREALRLLAADTTAVPIFEKVLRDKKELRANRQIAASALHSLNPDKFQQYARKIVSDKSDYDDIRATSLVALQQFGDDEALGKDKALLKSVKGFSGGKTQANYKQTARQFLSKYGQ